MYFLLAALLAATIPGFSDPKVIRGISTRNDSLVRAVRLGFARHRFSDPKVIRGISTSINLNPGNNVFWELFQ